MAITAVAQFNSSPLSTSDYQAQNAHINAFIQQMAGNVLHISEWNTTTVPTIPQGLYLRHAGVLYIVDTSAYSIQTGDLSGSGTYYIRIKDDGAGAIDSIDWESSLTGFSWNYAYQGMYDSSGHQVLPYSIVYDGSSLYTKYKWLNGNDSTALVGASGTILKNEYVVLDENAPQKVKITNAQAGSGSIGSTEEFTTVSTSYVKAGEIESVADGTVTTTISLKDLPGGDYPAYAKIYINGVPVGTERSTVSSTFVYFSENFTVEYGDLIQLYIHGTSNRQAVGRLAVSTLYGLQGYETH